MSGVVAHRSGNKASFQQREGFSLTYLPYVLAAAVSALREHPQVNATFNESPLHERGQTPDLTINPADAARLGVRDGEAVSVQNERGSFIATASVSSRVRRGVAVTVKGLSPERQGGSWVNATVAERDSDMGRGAVYHDNLVRLVPLAKGGGARERSSAGVPATTDAVSGR